MKFIVKFHLAPGVVCIAEGPNETTISRKVSKYRSDATVWKNTDKVFSMEEVQKGMSFIEYSDESLNSFSNKKKDFFVYDGSTQKLIEKITIIDGDEAYTTIAKKYKASLLRDGKWFYLCRKVKNKTIPFAIITDIELATSQVKLLN